MSFLKAKTSNESCKRKYFKLFIRKHALKKNKHINLISKGFYMEGRHEDGQSQDMQTVLNKHGFDFIQALL